jgi:hypothetical protein
MALSALFGLAGNLVGVGPLAWAAIRRAASRYARTRSRKSPTGTCNTFTIELRVEGAVYVGSVAASATFLMPAQGAPTAEGQELR